MLVLSFGGAYIRAHWSGLRAVAHEADPGWVLAAFVLGLAGQVAAMLGFAALLQAESAETIPTTKSARAFYVTQMGKYVPGSVWAVVAMANEVRRLGLRRAAGLRAILLSMLLSVALGFVLGGSLVLFDVLPRAAWILPVLGCSGLAAVVFRPERGLDLFRPLLRRVLPAHLSRPGLLRAAVVWPLVTWLLLGLHCWCLVVGLGGSTARSLVPAVGGFALAYVAGVVVVLAPSGIGVRETVLAVILAATLGATFGHDRAVVLVVASRVLLAIVDFVLAGAIIPIARAAARRHDPATT